MYVHTAVITTYTQLHFYIVRGLCKPRNLSIARCSYIFDINFWVEMVSFSEPFSDTSFVFGAHPPYGRSV